MFDPPSKIYTVYCILYTVYYTILPIGGCPVNLTDWPKSLLRHACHFGMRQWASAQSWICLPPSKIIHSPSHNRVSLLCASLRHGPCMKSNSVTRNFLIVSEVFRYYLNYQQKHLWPRQPHLFYNFHGQTIYPASNLPICCRKIQFLKFFCFPKTDDAQGKSSAGPSILELPKDHCGTD